MNRKERTQQNRFDTKIAPLIEELVALCEKFEMPMITAVQLFENDEDGARVNTHATHPKEMSLPMTLSTSLMNGTTQVRIADNNKLQLIMPKGQLPEPLKEFMDSMPSVSAIPFDDTNENLEPLSEHVKHCEDCKLLMDEAILRGESVDNILVPNHDDMGLIDLLDEIKQTKLPFIMPKSNIIH